MSQLNEIDWYTIFESFIHLRMDVTQQVPASGFVPFYRFILLSSTVVTPKHQRVPVILICNFIIPISEYIVQLIKSMLN